MTERNLTERELKAVRDLLKGKLTALTELLMHQPGDIHSTVHRTLLKLIDGEADATDYRLKIVRHPDIKNGQSTREWNAARRREIATATVMRSHGAEEDGRFESAVSATMAETGQSRATVTAHWREQRDFLIWIDELFSGTKSN